MYMRTNRGKNRILKFHLYTNLFILMNRLKKKKNYLIEIKYHLKINYLKKYCLKEKNQKKKIHVEDHMLQFGIKI